MGHLTERMQQRVVPANADRAWEILRDSGSLARMLARALPDSGAPRFALPLSDAPQPAVLVVTRDGHGVTCLAPGMHFDGPRLPHAQVVSYLRVQQERLRVGRATQALGNDTKDTLKRSIEYAYRFKREEFDFLRTVAPSLARLPLDNTVELVDRLDELAREPLRLKRFGNDHTAAAFWRLYCSAFTLMLASAAEEDAPMTALLALHGRDVFLASRALWILVQWPERTLTALEKIVERPALRQVLTGVELPLVCIAQRYFWLKKDTHRVLTACAHALGVHDATRIAGAFAHVSRPQWFARAWANRAHGIAGLFPKMARNIKPAPAPTRHAEDEALRQALEREAAALGEGALNIIRAWDPAAGFHQDPVATRWPPLGLVTPRQPGHLIWRLLQRVLPQSPCNRLDDALLVSNTPYEAMVPPRGLQEWKLTQGTNYVRERLLPLVHRPPPAPAPKAPEVGRNQPCTCGSGKKSKKCCAA